MVRNLSPSARRGSRGLLAAILALLLVFGAVGVVFALSGQVHAAPESLSSYVVKIAPPTEFVEATAPPGVLEERALARARDAVARQLGDLQTKGEVGSFAYDANQQGFRVQLSDAARKSLAANSLVSHVDPAPPANTAGPSGVRPLSSNSSVSSVDYIQVDSPFMWGEVNFGGLSVTATLYASDKTTVEGIAQQVAQSKTITIDRKTLYFETVFEDPNNPSHPAVMIAPGDWVNVVTSGTNPNNGQFQTDNRWIPVDDVQAWTSYQNDTISGHTSAANSQVIITVGSLSTSNYLINSTTPYASVTADANGNFSANSFITGTNPPKPIDLQQGSTGFVRVVHADLSEVFTVHGQNTLPLEGSSLVHGYAFLLPGAPFGLDNGVVVNRPAPNVVLTLANSQGVVKSTLTFASPYSQPYEANFGQTIDGGDTVTVQISNLTLPTITVSPLAGVIDLSRDQITGNGPANTTLTVSAGHVDGYMKSSSSVSYVQDQVKTDGSGNYASGAISCGSSNQVTLQPGSFGYVGYEDPHGNFIYEDFAAPTNDVLVNYPFIEGWVANGTIAPTVTVTDSNGTVQSTSAAVQPTIIWLLNQRLFIDTYYNVTPSVFVVPGDTVTVSGGSRLDQIPVDALAAYVNTDDSTVSGTAPVGASVKVIPDGFRTSYQIATANGSGNFTATNPYTTYNAASCSTGTYSETFTPGAVGRAYVTHADGNRVFTVWGRSMHVNENENVVELYLYPTANLDWSSTPAWSILSPDSVTLTDTPQGSSPVAVTQTTSGMSSYTKVLVVNGANQKVLIRGGDSLSVSFTEGSPGSPERTATMSLSNIPLVIAIPDVDANTVGGLGASSWSGQALLNGSTGANPIAIAARSNPAFGPVSFLDYYKKVVDLIVGNSGTISFSDQQGHRVWSAWAATDYPVKITGILLKGQTVVCGKATPSLGVHIFDATNQPQLTAIGNGTADSSGNFCVTVSPPLYHGEAVMAQDDNGTYSQPVVVGYALYLPFVKH